MKYNMTYADTIGKLNNGFAVRPQSFQYSYTFVMIYEGIASVIEIDPNDRRNFYYHCQYIPSGTDKLSKWALFDI